MLHRWGRTAESSPRGHDGADNRAGKSSAYIFSGRKDSLIWLCPPTSGGASPGGTSALSRAGPSGTLPPPALAACCRVNLKRPLARA